jgi:hypothetical protein
MFFVACNRKYFAGSSSYYYFNIICSVCFLLKVFILSVVLCLYCVLSYCSKRVIVCGLIVVMCFLCYLSVVLLLYHCHRVKTHLQLIIIII